MFLGQLIRKKVKIVKLLFNMKSHNLQCKKCLKRGIDITGSYIINSSTCHEHKKSAFSLSKINIIVSNAQKHF